MLLDVCYFKVTVEQLETQPCEKKMEEGKVIETEVRRAFNQLDALWCYVLYSYPNDRVSFHQVLCLTETRNQAAIGGNTKLAARKQELVTTIQNNTVRENCPFPF